MSMNKMIEAVTREIKQSLRWARFRRPATFASRSHALRGNKRWDLWDKNKAAWR